MKIYAVTNGNSFSLSVRLILDEISLRQDSSINKSAILKNLQSASFMLRSTKRLLRFTLCAARSSR